MPTDALPTNMQEFRNVMLFLEAICEQFAPQSDIAAAFAPTCRALASATPAQLCAVAGEVVDMTHARGSIYVTPRPETSNDR